ncbi:hypothetical protein [Paenibacillus assamensis]|uniref:hypothetical protein n=1 Tax=Paenibacillus assamensis TaxID=311244 RepID=UPI0003FF1BA5|nr:hypothetical protein [Paenibacillus assamensis]
MSREGAIPVQQDVLVQAWQQTLPTTLNPSDKATVNADEADPSGLRIHIDTAGRQQYSFDFACSYLDPREVRVQLIDVERDGQNVGEHTPVIQELAQNYVRQIHECAQTLQNITHTRSTNDGDYHVH